MTATVTFDEEIDEATAAAIDAEEVVLDGGLLDAGKAGRVGVRLGRVVGVMWRAAGWMEVRRVR